MISPSFPCLVESATWLYIIISLSFSFSLSNKYFIGGYHSKLECNDYRVMIGCMETLKFLRKMLCIMQIFFSFLCRSSINHAVVEGTVPGIYCHSYQILSLILLKLT